MAGHPPSQSVSSTSGNGSFPQNFQKVGGRDKLETRNAFHRKTCGNFSGTWRNCLGRIGNSTGSLSIVCPAGVERPREGLGDYLTQVPQHQQEELATSLRLGQGQGKESRQDLT